MRLAIVIAILLYLPVTALSIYAVVKARNAAPPPPCEKPVDAKALLASHR